MIRDHLDRLEWHCVSLDSLTPAMLGAPVDRANLSDVFEYLAPGAARSVLAGVANVARPGARLAYWNMIVPRRGSELLPHKLRALPDVSRTLFDRDKAFFYRDFIVEEVMGRAKPAERIAR